MTRQAQVRDLSLLRTKEIQQITGWSQPTIWRQVKYGNFPKPIKIGIRNHWKRTDIERWFNQLGGEA